MRIALGAGATVEGTVTHAGGEPATEVRIEAQGESAQGRDEALAGALTGADGSYRLPHLPAGAAKIVRRGGTSSLDDQERRSVALADGAVVRVDFVLGNRVEGTVRRGGLPVPGARVALTELAPPEGKGNRPSFDFQVQAGFTDADGRYAIGGVRAGEKLISISHGRQATRRVVPVADQPVTTLDVELPARLVTGVVVAKESGAPIAGATVHSTPPGEPRGNRSAMIRIRESDDATGETSDMTAGGGEQDETSSDAAGRFELLVAEGPGVRIGASAETFRNAAIDLPEGPGEAVTIALARQKRLIVTILGPDGRPPSPWAVCLMTERSQMCQTDGSERFEYELGDLLAGADMAVASPGLALAVQRLDTLEPDADGNVLREVRLAPAGTLSVRLPAPKTFALAELRPEGAEAELARVLQRHRPGLDRAGRGREGDPRRRAGPRPLGRSAAARRGARSRDGRDRGRAGGDGGAALTVAPDSARPQPRRGRDRRPFCYRCFVDDDRPATGLPDPLSAVRLTRAWFVGCESRELRGSPIARTIQGTPIVLYRSGGRAVAALDRCPHRNVPLSEGRVLGNGHLECRYHGWQFDGEGRCRAIPGLDAEVGEHRARDATPLAVREDGRVRLGRREPGPAAARRAVARPAPGRPPLRHRAAAVRRAGDAARHRRERARRAAHRVPSRRTVPLPGAPDRRRRRRAPQHRPRRGRVRRRAAADRPGAALLAPRGGIVTHVDRFILPSIVQVEYRLGDSTHLVSSAALTPIDALTTRLYAVVALRSPLPRLLVRLAAVPVMNRIFRQDAEMLALQTKTIRAFGGECFAYSPVDVLGPQIGRLLQRAAAGGEPADPEADREFRVRMLV